MNVKKLIAVAAVAAVSLCAGSALAEDCYKFDTKNGTANLGAETQKANCGQSSLILQGGVLTVKEIYFRPYNKQYFSWRNGTIVAARSNIFRIDAYADSTTRTMEVINGGLASFDTAGYDQTIPAAAIRPTSTTRRTGPARTRRAAWSRTHCL